MPNFRLLVLVSGFIYASNFAFADALYDRQFRDSNRDKFYKMVEKTERDLEMRKIELIEMREKTNVQKDEGYEEQTILVDQEIDVQEFYISADSDYRYDNTYTSNFFGDRIDVRPENIQKHQFNYDVIATLDKWIYLFSHDIDYKQFQEFPENDRFEHAWVNKLVYEANQINVQLTNSRTLLGGIAPPGGKSPRGISNTLSGVFGYDYSPKMSMKWNLTNSQTNALNDENVGSNSNDTAIEFQMKHKISPKTSVFGRYSRIWHRPKKGIKEEDIEGYGITAGVEMHPSSKLSVSGALGMGVRYYNVPSIYTQGTKTDWNGVGAINYSISKKINLNLGMARGAVPEALPTPDDPINVLAGATLIYKHNRNLKFQTGWSTNFIQGKTILSVLDPESDTIVNNRRNKGRVSSAKLGVEWALLEELTFGLAYEYGLSIFDNRNGNRKVHLLSGHVDYLF